MPVVDTSFLIALVKEDDRFHREIDVNSLRGEHLLVPWEIWVEFCEVIRRFARGPDVARVLESIRAGPFEIRAMVTEEELAEIVASSAVVQSRIAKAGFRPLSIFDLVVGHVAKRMKDSILTFDKGIEFCVRSGIWRGARLA